MVVSLLHNMSVPPRSAIQVKRSALAGLRFFVDCRWMGPSACELLSNHGAAAVLPLIEHGKNLDINTVAIEGSDAGEVAADEQMEAGLRNAAVPPRVGVFIPIDGVPDRAIKRLRREAALAVLARRSGPLYLPRRKFAPSLIAPLTALLVFPEDE